MAHQDDIQRLINEKQRRLQKLKDQAARYGISTPPHIIIEIEDIETELTQLQKQLEQTAEKPGNTLTQPTAAATKSSTGPTFNIGSIQAGQVNFGSTQQISGDQTINIDFSETQVAAGATVVQGDQFNFSRRANVNVKSTLESVSQTINNGAHIEQADQVKLQELLAQLNAALQQAPADKTEEAETIAELASDLVGMVAKETPNKAKAQITASGLRQAAANLDELVPTVLPLTTQIVGHVAKLID